MPRPRLSILLVSHNRPEYLREAVRSIFEQTIGEWELIIVENSEPQDPAVDMVCREAADDSRVKVIYHGGTNIDNIARCWNEALDVVTGEYWGTLDDDNRKAPRFCEKMSAFLDAHPEKLAVVCGMRHTGEKNGYHIPNQSQLATLRSQNSIDSGEIVYRRTVIDKIGYFDERLLTQEDWDYVLRFFTAFGNDAAGFLGEALADYRWHTMNRMKRSLELGMLDCARILQSKFQAERASVVFAGGEDSALTVSQRDVRDGVRSALEGFCFIETNQRCPDLAVVCGPLWNFTAERLRAIKAATRAPLLTLLIEDPQGITGNLPLIPDADWIVTNDRHAFDLYRSIVGNPEHVYHWNCLSLTDEVLQFCQETRPEKLYDVCFIGYPYPSRVKFMTELRRLLPEINMLLIGDTWDQHGIIGATTRPTLSDADTAAFGLVSRIILCKHRTEEDLGGFPVILPGSVNRGYIECAYRALVMIDTDRPHHSFSDEVEWYDSAEDAAEKIRHYLANPEALGEKVEKAFAAAPKFTYRERIGKIINGFRSPRYNMMIA